MLGGSSPDDHFGTDLRVAGIQRLVGRDRAHHPVGLSMDGDQVELRYAAQLWGVDAGAASESLHAELSNVERLMLISPGGENGVPYAFMMIGTRHSAGRTTTCWVISSKIGSVIAVPPRA